MENMTNSVDQTSRNLLRGSHLVHVEVKKRTGLDYKVVTVE